MFHTLSGLYSIRMLLSYQKTHIRMETLYDGFSLSVFNFNGVSIILCNSLILLNKSESHILTSSLNVKSQRLIIRNFYSEKS